MTEGSIQNHTGLPDAQAQECAEHFGGFELLTDIVKWCAAQQPPVAPVLTIAQDEFSHDVVIPHPGGLHLVFGVT